MSRLFQAAHVVFMLKTYGRIMHCELKLLNLPVN